MVLPSVSKVKKKKQLFRVSSFPLRGQCFVQLSTEIFSRFVYMVCFLFPLASIVNEVYRSGRGASRQNIPCTLS